MEIKSEKSIKEFLKTLPDDDIIKYYLDVEYSPFPVLVIEEYTRRFKRKTKDEILKDLKTQARFAHKKTREFGKIAKKHKFVDDVTKQKSEEIFKQAKKKGFEISEKLSYKGGILGSKLKKGTTSGIKSGINAGKNIKSSSVDELELLEKLGDLQKAGIITKKEFLEKKKKILSKI
ncbi:hypothetical protein NZNM25_03280 [Nitrosopumilus zosterae]|uniref:SHOCT domain-containing protein n=1 Tax=Nitrosopumilus zosterae TaxID=718286 RepID=A0A2S2KPQ1_9ARCH|nr:hypothetical protein [Nitrosopumilus zosterae]BDQ31327.1 hypothetical protein NZOSNM25_001440 [Nitrosopumilus zosterae]GBH33537.1 hypothetical protein NZNM25_03280 [Nitrosopumilus zosterae]